VFKGPGLGIVILILFIGGVGVLNVGALTLRSSSQSASIDR